MDDLIRRQDAIDAISTWDKFGVDERNRLVRWYEGLEPYVKLRDVVWAIEKLPSTHRKGKWIVLDECSNEGVYCSECNKKVLKIDYSNTMKWKNFNYCPNCGASMVRGEEE